MARFWLGGMAPAGPFPGIPHVAPCLTDTGSAPASAHYRTAEPGQSPDMDMLVLSISLTHTQQPLRTCPGHATACRPAALSRAAVGGQGEKTASQPDELIDFAHLKARQGLSQLELEDEVATDLQRATGLANADAADGAGLNRVLQLSGAPPAAARAPQTAACAGACACAALACRLGEVATGPKGGPLWSMQSV